MDKLVSQLFKVLERKKFVLEPEISWDFPAGRKSFW